MVTELRAHRLLLNYFAIQDTQKPFLSQHAVQSFLEVIASDKVQGQAALPEKKA